MKHVSTPIFYGLFKNIVFRSVALVTKKLWAILDFVCTQTGLFTALYPTLCIKKNSLNFFSLKVTKYVGDSVKNVTARTKKIERRGASTPACLGLNVPIIYFKCSSMPDDDLGCSCSKNAVFLPKGLLFKLVEKTGRGYAHISPPPTSFHCYIYLADEIFLHQIWRTGRLSGTGNFQNLNIDRVNHKERDC